MTEPANLPPETHNAEQDDAPQQAQALADEALGRASTFSGSDTEKVPAVLSDEDSSPDLVDHMNQMVSSGHIDMSAFRGERMDDDEEGGLGAQGIEDDFPRGAE